MALPTYPPAMPAPSPTFLTLDRGCQNYILINAGATNAQVGTAAPVGSTVFAIPPGVSFEQAPPTFTFQLDAFGTPAAVVTAYGSLDGVNFYTLGALQASGTYGLFTIVDKKIRFLTANVTAYGGSGGTTDSITVSLYA